MDTADGSRATLSSKSSGRAIPKRRTGRGRARRTYKSPQTKFLRPTTIRLGVARLFWSKAQRLGRKRSVDANLVQPQATSAQRRTDTPTQQHPRFHPRSGRLLQGHGRMKLKSSILVRKTRTESWSYTSTGRTARRQSTTPMSSTRNVRRRYVPVKNMMMWVLSD